MPNYVRTYTFYFPLILGPKIGTVNISLYVKKIAIVFLSWMVDCYLLAACVVFNLWSMGIVLMYSLLIVKSVCP